MIISTWWLRKSSKFNGQEYEEIYRNIESLETPKQGEFLYHKVVNAIKSVLIIQQLASDAVGWQEDHYAIQQQQ